MECDDNHKKFTIYPTDILIEWNKISADLIIVRVYIKINNRNFMYCKKILTLQKNELTAHKEKIFYVFPSKRK